MRVDFTMHLQIEPDLIGIGREANGGRLFHGACAPHGTPQHHILDFAAGDVRLRQHFLHKLLVHGDPHVGRRVVIPHRAHEVCGSRQRHCGEGFQSARGHRGIGCRQRAFKALQGIEQAGHLALGPLAGEGVAGAAGRGRALANSRQGCGVPLQHGRGCPPHRHPPGHCQRRSSRGRSRGGVCRGISEAHAGINCFAQRDQRHIGLRIEGASGGQNILQQEARVGCPRSKLAASVAGGSHQFLQMLKLLREFERQWPCPHIGQPLVWRGLRG